MSRRFVFLSGCLLAAPVLSAPEPKAPEKLVYWLPSGVGDTLVYEETLRTPSATFGRPVTRTVISVERKGSVVITTIHEKKPETDTQTETYRQTDNGLFVLSRDAKQFDLPQCVPRLPLKAGDSWEVKYPTGSPSIIKYTTGTEEEIKVPAGKFKALRIEKETEVNCVSVRLTEWAVPGFGVVKVVCKAGDDTEVALVLKAFTPGKN